MWLSPGDLHSSAVQSGFTAERLSDLFPFLKQALVKGHGAAALPRYKVADELRAGVVQRMCPGWTVSGLGDRRYIITAEDRRPLHAVKALTQFLKASLQRFVQTAGHCA